MHLFSRISYLTSKWTMRGLVWSAWPDCWHFGNCRNAGTRPASELLTNAGVSSGLFVALLRKTKD